MPKNIVALGIIAAPIIAKIGLANSGEAMAMGRTASFLMPCVLAIFLIDA